MTKKEIKEHEQTRVVMSWGIKYRQLIFKNGKPFLSPEKKIMTPMKYLDDKRIENIIQMLNKSKGHWNNYDYTVWLAALNDEITYREQRLQVIIDYIKTLEHNSLGRLFDLHDSKEKKIKINER